MDEPFGALDTHTKTRLHADVLMIALSIVRLAPSIQAPPNVDRAPGRFVGWEGR